MNRDDVLEIARKRLNWRASHRGIKEMDILVGGYAAFALPEMGQDELLEFEQLLDVPDQDLLSYVTAQSAVPAALDTPMMRALLAFRPA